jgi:hypothetical protein
MQQNHAATVGPTTQEVMLSCAQTGIGILALIAGSSLLVWGIIAAHHWIFHVIGATAYALGHMFYALGALYSNDYTSVRMSTLLLGVGWILGGWAVCVVVKLCTLQRFRAASRVRGGLWVLLLLVLVPTDFILVGMLDSGLIRSAWGCCIAMVSFVGVMILFSWLCEPLKIDAEPAQRGGSGVSV